MSSKSRKPTPKPARHPAAPASGAAAGEGPTKRDATDPEYAEPGEREFQEAEDLLKVPRGRSKGTYAFLIFLLIFLTATFVVLDFMPYFGGGRGAETEMSWERPGVGRETYNVSQWQREMRRFSLTMEFLQGNRRVEDERVAELVVLDALASDMGVRITEQELSEQLRGIAQQMGGVAAYEQTVRARRGLTVAEFEETVRRLLRVQRLRNYMALIAAQPSPAAIESLWNDRRRETAYEYVVVATADFHDAARAEAPDDAALQAWFDARPASDRAPYEGAASTRAELVGAPLDADVEPDFPALFAAYPDADDVDAAARGRQYYDQFAYVRFPAPEGAEGQIYRTYDEVAERAAAEARVLAALRAWREELAARVEAGETIDLASEAERLGLVHDAPEDARTQIQWREAGGLAGTYLAGQIVRLAEGAFAPGVVVEQAGLTVARALEQRPSSVLPFDEIRDRVLEEWVDEHAQELAVEALRDLRAAALASSADGETESGETESAESADVGAEAFAEAARAAGFEVGRRDWLDTGAPVDSDPDAALPAHEILRTRAPNAELEPGELTEPLLAIDGEHAVLARLADARPVPLDRMGPADFTSFTDQARQRIEFDWAFGGGPLAFEALRERFDIHLASEERRAKRLAEEALEAAGEPATEPPAEGS